MTIATPFPLLLLLQALALCLSFSIDSQQHERVFISTPSKPTVRIVSDLMTSQPRLLALAPHAPVDEAIAFGCGFLYLETDHTR